MAEEVKLFGFWGSPFSRRVEMALKLKGIPYEYTEEDLSNKSPMLLKYNPVHKKIPVLLHNGKPIAESAVILQYIDETWKGTAPILPEDPYERAMARFWAKFIDEKCMPTLWKVFWGQGEEQQKAKEEASELMKTLEGQLKGKKFFGGDKIGFLDIVANFIGFWMEVIQEAKGLEFLTEERFPILCKWVQQYANCSAIKESLPPREELLAFWQARSFIPTVPQ